MKSLKTILVLVAFFSIHMAQANPRSDSAYTDKLDKFAAGVVHDVITSLTPVDELKKAQRPDVVVKLGGGFIYFDDVNNQVVVPPPYAQLPKPIKDELKIISPAPDDETTADFYNLLFNQFLIAHEASHWIQENSAIYGSDSRYDSEREANEMAASYWARTESGQAMLNALAEHVRNGKSRLTNPVPDDVDAAEYFHDNYHQLAQSMNDYGYFQYQFILEAIEKALP